MFGLVRDTPSRLVDEACRLRRLEVERSLAATRCLVALRPGGA